MAAFTSSFAIVRSMPETISTVNRMKSLPFREISLAFSWVVRLRRIGPLFLGTTRVHAFAKEALLPQRYQMPRNAWGISETEDRKSTRLNSSHEWISYAVFCLKKKQF